MQPMRRRRQKWSIDQRRLRKLFKFLRAQFLYNYGNVRMSVFFSTLLFTLWLCCRLSRDDSGEARVAFESKAAFVLPTQSRAQLLSEETKLYLEHICKRKKLENNVEELRFCGSFPSSRNKKIVGLVEVRNVEASITPFLSALGQVVDSVVIIDDHSTDGSRNRILQQNVAHTSRKPLVEVLLNKSGDWTREELFDRELLLTTARSVDGTHFVLLDYDEYLSANCVENGLLRRSILQLSPGESLYIPWVELWKSHTLQRVLPDDPMMNFLTRRQTVIFADDGTSHYTKESATARLLGSHFRNSSLHVLRCPRTICPKPPKYTGPDSDLGNGNRVKRLSQCAIVEMRFLNLNNVLLKSAWYEALGRVMGADDGVTSGKMIDRLFPNQRFSSEDGSRLEAVSPKLLGEYAVAGARGLEGVEVWRAKELLYWMDFRGKSTFAGLRSLALIDTDGLRNMLHQAHSPRDLYHVPRRKDGTFVVVHEHETTFQGPVGKFLLQVGFSQVELGHILDTYPEVARLGSRGERGLQYEQWKAALNFAIHSALRKASSTQAFVILSSRSESLCLTFLDVVRRELSDTNVVILTTTSSSSVRDDTVSMQAKTFARERGSHIQLLHVPIENFGSYSAVHWLRNRLSTETIESNQTEAVGRSILDFVETLHTESQHQGATSASPRYAAVGKLIFSLNFGRSGSKYLADVIGTTRGLVVSQHEPLCPDGGCSGGGALRMQNKSLVSSYEERKVLKLPMIRQAMMKLSRRNDTSLFESRTVDCDASDILTEIYAQSWDNFRGNGGHLPIFEVNSRSGCVVQLVHDAVYAETNPNFKSWIYDVSLDFFPKAGYDVRVVVLRKYSAALLKSLYETGYFTVRDGFNWMETAAGINSKVRLASLQDDAQLDGYGKILSYLVNSEAVFRQVVEHYGNGKKPPRFLEMRSERLYSIGGTLEVLDWLGLEPTETSTALAGSVRDKYVEGTSKKRMSVPLAECERRVKQFLEHIKDEGEARVVQDLLGSLDKMDDYEYPS